MILTERISVALCADKNIEIGLHVTLYSLLENSKCKIKINLIHSGYTSHDIDKLYKTLYPFSGRYELNDVFFDDHFFRNYRGLHGNKYAFVKLMLPHLLNDDKVIYLDSDLLIRKDLSVLFATELGRYVIGVSGIAELKWSIDCEFLVSVGLASGENYFNSGVMLIDMVKWRQLSITDRCLIFSDKFSRNLLAADQTVLNYVFRGGNFLELDASWNHALYPYWTRVPLESAASIFHFVGSPKPWDFLGEVIHTNYPLFYSTLSKTEFSNYKTYQNWSLKRARRTVRLSRAYLDCLRRRAGLRSPRSFSSD